MTALERVRRSRAKARAAREAAIPQPKPPPARIVPFKLVIDRTREPSPMPEPVLCTNPGEYPRWLYHPDGRTTVVDTPQVHQALITDGWGMAPLAIHRQRPVSHHGVLGTYNPFSRPLPRW